MDAIRNVSVVVPIATSGTVGPTVLGVTVVWTVGQWSDVEGSKPRVSSPKDVIGDKFVDILSQNAPHLMQHVLLTYSMCCSHDHCPTPAIQSGLAAPDKRLPQVHFRMQMEVRTPSP